MDGLQHQINTLNQKVEQLHQIVERLTGQLTVLASPHIASSPMSSDQPLQPLPKLSHREEKLATAQTASIESQEESESVDNGYHNDNRYSDSTSTELVGNSYHYKNSHPETTELVGNGYHHNSNGHNTVSEPHLDSQKGYYRLAMEHKDVLLEDKVPQTTLPDPLHEPSVASDIQIRRLMAQLTAAYNRIAILEEQLIACRMRS
ncbi:MAG: hypothetical protein AB4041_18810 [Microcystaceae cyanobacterium]